MSLGLPRSRSHNKDAVQAFIWDGTPENINRACDRSGTGKANKRVFSSHHWVTGDWSLLLQETTSVRHVPQSHLLKGEGLGMCAHPPVSHWLRAAPQTCARWAWGPEKPSGSDRPWSAVGGGGTPRVAV